MEIRTNSAWPLWRCIRHFHSLNGKFSNVTRIYSLGGVWYIPRLGLKRFGNGMRDSLKIDLDLVSDSEPEDKVDLQHKI